MGYGCVGPLVWQPLPWLSCAWLLLWLVGLCAVCWQRNRCCLLVLLVVICGIGVVLWCVAQSYDDSAVLWGYGLCGVGSCLLCAQGRGLRGVFQVQLVVGIKKSQLVQTRGRFCELRPSLSE